MFSCEFCEISKRTFSYGTSPVAASARENYVWPQKLPGRFHTVLITWNGPVSTKSISLLFLCSWCCNCMRLLIGKRSPFSYCVFCRRRLFEWWGAIFYTNSRSLKRTHINIPNVPQFWLSFDEINKVRNLLKKTEANVLVF